MRGQAFWLKLIGITCLAVTTCATVDSAGAAQNKSIRVGLEDSVASVEISILGSYRLVDEATNKVLKGLSTADSWTATPVGGSEIHIKSSTGVRTVTDKEGNLFGLGSEGELVEVVSNYFVSDRDQVASALKGIKLSLNGKDYGTFQGPIRVQETAHATVNSVNVNQRAYRGDLELVGNQQGKITVINELLLEEYLWGVVASEMPSSWGSEALKAQAVVARNYALKQQAGDRFRQWGFDVTDDTRSQAYGGIASEKAATTKAVNDTRGIVALSGHELIDAYYHASSGGVTENSEDVWAFPLPYLRTKVDLFDANTKHYNWQVVLTKEELLQKFKAKGLVLSTITGLEAEEMTDSGLRVKSLKVSGLDLNGEEVSKSFYNADNVRSLFGLKSSLFTMMKDVNINGEVQAVSFTGSGWGHGLGMSQYGAQGMAAQGSKYDEILEHYFTGITLVENYND